MLEMSEYECGPGDIAYLPVGLGDMLEYAPALGEQSKTAFTDAPH